MTFHEIMQIFMGFIGSLGFAVLFNIRGKKLAAAAFGGLISWLLFILIGFLNSNETIRYFFVSLIISAYAEIMARVLKTPTTTFIITSLIPLIPGGSLYYTMANAFSGDLGKFLSSAINTLKLAIALALGVVVMSTVTKILNKFLKK